MGGKVWSDGEEEVFWSVLAKLAPPGLHEDSKAVKKGHKKKDHKGAVEDSWTPLIALMQRLMWEKTGKKPPRDYTAVSLYEHLFQNLHQGKLSPNALRHVEKHRAWLKTMAENPESAFEVEGSSSRKSVESGSSESTASNESTGSESHSTLENSTPPNAIPQAAMRQQMPQLQQLPQMREAQYMVSSGGMSYPDPSQAGHHFLTPLTAPTNGQQRQGANQLIRGIYDTHSLPWPLNDPEFIVMLPDHYKKEGSLRRLLSSGNKGMVEVLYVIRKDIIQSHRREGFSDQAGRFGDCLRAIDDIIAVNNNSNYYSSFMGNGAAQTNYSTVSGSGGALKRKRSDLWTENESRATERKRQLWTSHNPA